MNAAPHMLYALSQIRQRDLDRAARTAWQRRSPEPPPTSRPVRAASVRTDAVAAGC